MDLFFLNYSMARIFGTETLFDVTNTGIVDVDLVLYTKISSVVKSDIDKNSDNIVKNYLKY
jgi:hypothetical protein